ncbi:hypothetical protein HYPSUDRAFT_76127 [Hypholoma sublateritium FD-334 SS-4]|uniref:Peptidase C14 caspase domain-containing protein n=1 Tax=Hypholoma sublateritium (strain FD-334 SS-4) TaxID=945553 RepID=A0A0D2P8X1_HYPSF|nr:hypothetical protein HYPSUDRAFT_76127 [Hypholoma sublateritium FD-334 SS-4]
MTRIPSHHRRGPSPPGISKPNDQIKFQKLATSRTFSRLFALLVGINDYNPPPLGLRPLRGAVADAQTFKQWLEWSGVPSENIVLLTNESATCSAIITALTQLKTDHRIRHGDPILIFFAGHGAEVNAPDGWECGRADRMIQVIVPHDCEAIKSGKRVGPIADRVLGALIGNIAEQKDNNIFVVLDCCHSASGTRGSNPSDVDNEVTSRAVDLVNDYSASLEQQLRNIGAYQLASMPDINFTNSSIKSHVLLAACSQSEDALEYRDPQAGFMRGRFTAALLNFLYTTPLNTIRYSDILSRMERITSQNPHCEGHFVDRIIFNSKIPDGPRKAITVQYEEGSPGRRGQYILLAGRMQQIQTQSKFDIFEKLDFNQVSRLGTLTVIEVRDLSSVATVTPVGHVSLEPKLDIVAVQKKSNAEDDLKIFIPRGNSFLPEYHYLKRLDGMDGICLVQEQGNANINISMDQGKLSLIIRTLPHALLAPQEWEHTFKYDPRSAETQSVLSKAVHFFRHLKPASSHFDTYIYDNITLKVFELADDLRLGGRKPVEPNLFDGNIIAIPHKHNVYHGIELTNGTSDLDLHVSIFIFSFSDLSIVPIVESRPNAGYRVDHSLSAGQKLALGWGAAGIQPIDSVLADDQAIDIQYLKVYISTQPTNMSFLAQTSPFSGKGILTTTPASPGYPRGVRQVIPATPPRWTSILVPLVVFRPGATVVRRETVEARLGMLFSQSTRSC